jgi:hypothetical protein
MSFFFTLLDDSLRPRGSRDPLGIELLWSNVGRKLIGNLTTVTTHLDNFILTLVGFYLCGSEGQEAPDWECFERFEQMTSRARVRCELPGVLGVRRIRSSLDSPVVLGSGKDARILDDQRQAGLWGLYSTALTSSGLTDGTRRPTLQGAEIVSMLLQVAPGDVWRLALDKKRRQLQAADMDKVETWVVALLRGKHGRTRLANCLLSGSGTRVAWQHEVFEQAKAFMKDRADIPPARDFLLWLTEHSIMLRDFAGRVLEFDEALVLAALTFAWLLGCHGRSAKEIETQLAGLNAWPFRVPPVPNFSAEISDGEWRKRACGIADFCAAMGAGEWRQATEVLLNHHAGVVQGRGGSPWCYWENDYIKVVMNTAPGTLPAKEEIAGEKFVSWMNARSNGFFLGSFLAILHQAGVQQKGGA